MVTKSVELTDIEDMQVACHVSCILYLLRSTCGQIDALLSQ